MVGRLLELDELVEFFTLLPDETALLRNKSGATRLGFALLLKFLTHRGRFPSGRVELPGEAVEFVAKQVRVPASQAMLELGRAQKTIIAATCGTGTCGGRSTKASMSSSHGTAPTL